MSRRSLSLLLALAALGTPALSPPAAAAPAAAEPARRAVPDPAFHEVFTDADYPKEALAKEEAGAVGFRLSVGADGRVRDCAVEISSGSPSLDSTTCRLLLERARFTPAADAAGKPVPDVHRGRITWALPARDELPPRASAAVDLWNGCILGEVAKLTPSTMAAPDVMTRALGACAELEALYIAELSKVEGYDGAGQDLAPGKKRIAQQIEKFLTTTRAILAPEGNK